MLSCSMKRVRVSAEAVGVLPLMLNRSFDFAQDDGVGAAGVAGVLGAGAGHHPPYGHPLQRRGHRARGLRSQRACLTLVLNGSFDFAQDDGVGGLRSQRVCLGLVLGITRPTGTLFREEGIARVNAEAAGMLRASAERAP